MTLPDPEPTPAGPTLEDYQRAWHTLCERLQNEAESRDWCSDYDYIVDEINCHLPGGIEVPVRRRQVTISFCADLTPDEADKLEACIDDILIDWDGNSCSDYEWH